MKRAVSRRQAAPPARRESGWVALLLAAVPAALGAALVLSKLSDSDFWWHLRTGRWIIEHHAIPRADIYSYTIAGRPWVAFEWLSQCVFYGLFRLAGAEAIVLFKSALTAALALLMLGYGRSRRLAFLAASGPVALLALCAGRASLLERPQLFTFLLTAAYLNILKRGESRPRSLWALVGLQAAWANLHGGASAVGLMLVACALAGSLAPLGASDAAEERRARAWRLGAVLAACVVATTANPFGWKVFAHLLGTVDFKTRELISEWAPLRFDAASRFVWMPLLALEALSAAAWLANPRRRWADAFVWLGFLLLSFRAVRFATEAALVFGQLFAGDWAGIVSERTLSRRASAAAAALSLGLSVAAAWGFQTRCFSSFFQAGLGVGHDAGSAIAYARMAGLKGPIFNSYEFGGPLIWHDPGRPVFVDGRNLEYGPDFTWDAMHWFEPEVWKRLERRWGFEVAFIQNGPAYLCGVLDSDPAWRLVYWDDEALVYARADGPNAAAAEGGYRLLRPNETGLDYLSASLSDPARAQAALAEAQRAAAAAPESINAVLLEAFLLRRLGQGGQALPLMEKAARDSPERAEVLAQLGRLYQAQGRLVDAADLYRRAAKFAGRLGPRGVEVEALNNLGVLAYMEGDRPEAARLWRRALALDPASASARHNLGQLGLMP